MSPWPGRVVMLDGVLARGRGDGRSSAPTGVVPVPPMSRPLTLGYLTSQYARASDSFIRGEVRALRSLGHNVHTFSIRRPEGDADLCDDVRDEQATTDYVLERGALAMLQAVLHFALHAPRAALRSAWLAWRLAGPGLHGHFLQVAYLVEAAYLARRLQQLGIEHLHNHFGDGCATVAMLAAELSGVPYSLAIHGPAEFFGAERSRLGEKIERSAFTTCISHFGRSQCMIFAPPEAWERLELVRCGIDERFLDEAIAPLPAARRLVAIGRLSPEKGQLLLLEAVARVARVVPDLELELIGDGPLRAALEERIHTLELGERVELSGWQPAARVREALLRARGLVVPSFAEGLPVVIMEALAMGRPVLSTRIAGIPELVEDGACGWLFEAGSVNALANAVERALTTPDEELEAFGRVGRERVARCHDQVREAERLAAIIEKRSTRG